MDLPSPIQHLPDETLQIIFQYLPFETRKTASLVCRRWNEIAMPCSNIVFGRRYLQSFSEHLIKLFMSSERRYKHVKVSDSDFPVKHFERLFHCLETLTIGNDIGRNNMLRELNRFEKLKLIYLNNNYFDDKLQSVEHTCNSLKEIVANEVAFQNFTHFIAFIGQAFPELTKLQFYHCTIFKPSGNDPAYNISNLPALKQVVIEDGSKLDIATLKPLQSLPNLRFLRLFCSELEGIDQIEQSFHLDQVQQLDITVMVYECYLLRLVEIFPALTSLTVEAREKYLTASIEAKAVEKLPRSCNLSVKRLSNLVMGSDIDDCDGKWSFIFTSPKRPRM